MAVAAWDDFESSRDLGLGFRVEGFSKSTPIVLS